MEEHTVLWHDPHGSPEAVQGHVANVFVPQEDPAIGWVIESIQETDYGGLPKERSVRQVCEGETGKGR